MRVRNLVSWAGEGFSHVPGDILELPDDMAAARIEGGVAEEAPPETPTTPKLGRKPKAAKTGPAADNGAGDDTSTGEGADTSAGTGEGADKLDPSLLA